MGEGKGKNGQGTIHLVRFLLVTSLGGFFQIVGMHLSFLLDQRQ